MLYQIDNLIEGTIIKRPSKFIKSPYVADVLLKGDETTILAHSASLGCSGLAEAESNVLLAKIESNKKNDDMKCSYRIYLSIIKNGDSEEIVGVYPKFAEHIAESALKQNFISCLQNIKSYKRETSIYIEGQIDSRFDFSGIDENGCPFIMEIKNVPLADYEDGNKKDKKKMDFSSRDFNSKVAYFPDGYRKKITDVISPRALKHIKELIYIKQNSKTRTILCYVIQRSDINRFQTSINDLVYKQAVKEANDIGVEIIALVVKWMRDGKAYFVSNNLPIYL